MNAQTVVSINTFAVMVNLIRKDSTANLAFNSGMTFMDAADYATNAQGYFRFAILENLDWEAIEIEIGNGSVGTIELIRITR